jgi:hypothetical protein
MGTARTLAAGGQGLLAIDERNATRHQHPAGLGIARTDSP